jgi:hypothetical protein
MSNKYLTPKIGRFEVPIQNIQAVKQRTGLFGWLLPGYDVYLAGGVKIRLSNEEKAELDAAREQWEKMRFVHATIQNVKASGRAGSLR